MKISTNASAVEYPNADCCAVCHGFDGKAMNFKTPENAKYIGTVAKENPQETSPKIIAVQLGVPMVVVGVLDTQDLVDIFTQAQALSQR